MGNKQYKCAPGVWATNFTPLMVACTENSLFDVKAYSSLDPSSINKKNSEGWTALHIACRNSRTCCSIEIVRKLIEAGADLNLKNNDGWTPLHLAVKYADTDSSLETVRELLSSGADPNLQNNFGFTPLYLSTSSEITAELLKAGANPNIKDKSDLDQLHYMISYPFHYTMPSPLHCIVLRPLTESSLDIVTELLNAGADLNMKNGQGNTPLYIATEKSSNNSHLEIIKEFLKAGADPNLQNRFKNTPLHIAVTKSKNDSHLEIIKELLKAGADPNLQNIDKSIPLHSIMWNYRENPSIETILTLIKHTTSGLNKMDYLGRTPIEFARQRELPDQIIQLMIEQNQKYLSGFINNTNYSPSEDNTLVHDPPSPDPTEKNDKNNML